MSVENKPGFGAISRGRASMEALRTLAGIRRAARLFAEPDEVPLLRQFSGWGPLKDVFAPKDEAWSRMAEELSGLLSEQDITTGMQGTYNAFYTPTSVTEAMWGLLQALGFSGGQVAELGCGTGAFMQTAPDGAAVVGVERDPTAAAIAALLNPGHTVIGRRLEEVTLPASFGAVIGNIPFGDVRVFDPSAPKDTTLTSSLHNYFIWRALSCLAPGGVAVLLTSRFTLDAIDPSARRELSELGDFLGAIRLPSGGLEGGTEVVADVVVLRRKVPGEPITGHGWVPASTAKFGDENPVNVFWSERPGLVLGVMRRGETQQYGRGVVVDPIGGESAADGIRRVTATVAADAARMGGGWVGPVDVADFDAAEAEVISKEGWLENSFHKVGKDIHVVVHGVAQPMPSPSRELRALVDLRDMAERLVEAEADHGRADAVVDRLRKPLAVAYAAYVRRFGYLNRSTIVSKGLDEDGVEQFSRRNPSMGGFRHDPGSALVFALEIWDDDTRDGRPAPILTARQNRPIVRPDHTDEPATALAWCLDRTGGVDLGYIAQLLGIDGGDGEHIAALLGDAVFQDPGYERWLTAEEYLSGDVRDKLAAAETAAIVEPRYQRNVDALKAALPKWLGPDDIKAVLGTPWIGPGDVAQFITDLLGGGATVRRLKQSNRWEVEGGFRNSTKSCEEWGTPDVDGYTLIQLALNGKSPEVRRRVGKDKTVKDETLSLQAAEMQQRIKERFSQWVWEDGFRCDRLVTYYNANHNCLTVRRYNGDHITVDGLAPEWAGKLYPHQREFIARALATPGTLCGHPVGGGKTATMTCAAMKLKQVGLVDTPMLVVPNHLRGQAESAARQMFPGAKILSSSSETIAKSRRAFTARVATQPWDLIIITQSAFDRMPVNPETEREYLELQRVALRESLIEASPDGEMKGRMVKSMAKKLDTLEAKIKDLRHRAHGPDGGVTFEQLGVRWIGIDEAHNYKNLAVPCYNEGFQIAPSKRATHLDMILRWLSGQGSGRYAALFTGTPVSNTMLELYVMQQYLMPEYLSSIGLGSADAWVSAFVEMVTKVGVTVNGGSFEIKTRPERFVNAPELRVLFSMVADIRTAEQLGLKRPAVVEETVKVQPTRAQAGYALALVDRAQALKGVRFPEKGADNMLKVCNDGRWMATDPHLVGLDDNEPSKLHAVAEKMMGLWRAHPQELQIGFCDVGTPNDAKGTQTYGRLAKLLTDMGMPRERIRFIHTAKSDEDKVALFRACNTGKVSVILGSTGKLGTGTNIQERVIAMHHIDAPYTPSGVEQRRGRGERPGNRNPVINNLVYVTARTFDAYLWQMLVRKLAFISQLMSGNLDREIEDCQSDQLMNFSAVQASATDQPLLLERSEVEAQVNRLRTMQGGHRSMQQRQRAYIPALRKKISEKRVELQAWTAIASANTPVLDEAGLKELGEKLHESMQDFRYRMRRVMFGDLEVTFSYWLTATSQQREPQLQVNGGSGVVTDNVYCGYKPDTLVERLLRIVAKADAAVQPYGDLIATLEEELRQKEALLLQEFDQQDELTAKLARLDQIDADLRREAVKHEMQDVDAVVSQADYAESDGGHDDVDLSDDERQLLAGIEAGAGIDLGSVVVPDSIPVEVVDDVAGQLPEVVRAAEQPVAAAAAAIDLDDILGGLVADAEVVRAAEPGPVDLVDDILGSLVADYESEMDRRINETMAALGI